ncbi:hypothetical protein EVA_10614 [gut metagenome]|uniref:Uncharacterized protein n=1 Tax=gut metagenome TaxID=749906 RepID=J9G357_9ZZZZ
MTNMSSKANPAPLPKCHPKNWNPRRCKPSNGLNVWRAISEKNKVSDQKSGIFRFRFFYCFIVSS